MQVEIDLLRHLRTALECGVVGVASNVVGREDKVAAEILEIETDAQPLGRPVGAGVRSPFQRPVPISGALDAGLEQGLGAVIHVIDALGIQAQAPARQDKGPFRSGVDDINIDADAVCVADVQHGEAAGRASFGAVLIGQRRACNASRP